MKIVVISDTHLPERADRLPAKLLEEIKSADMLVHAGDFVSPELFKELKSLCKNVKAVWGNMDPQEIREELTQKEIFKVGNFKIGLYHGCGAPSSMVDTLSAEFKNDKPDIIIFGHSHSALNEKRAGILFFNPGSPTDKVFAAVNTYGIIEINDNIESRIVQL
ncbi:MAG: metallophosphoesterase [Candidatus Omnitrophica bacterium]|nr:metallophosphoesterase [Candidatus Omnitrophota bacterium]